MLIDVNIFRHHSCCKKSSDAARAAATINIINNYENFFVATGGFEPHYLHRRLTTTVANEKQN